MYSRIDRNLTVMGLSTSRATKGTWAARNGKGTHRSAKHRGTFRFKGEASIAANIPTGESDTTEWGTYKPNPQSPVRGAEQSPNTIPTLSKKQRCLPDTDGQWNDTGRGSTCTPLFVFILSWADNPNTISSTYCWGRTLPSKYRQQAMSNTAQKPTAALL